MSDDAKGFRLFLVGPMGSGKSTVGRHLAGLLDCPFIDSDAEIESRAGADIPGSLMSKVRRGFADARRRY
jgi:shikimate kinase